LLSIQPFFRTCDFRVSNEPRVVCHSEMEAFDNVEMMSGLSSYAFLCQARMCIVRIIRVAYD
jgi:hypothetical protein